MRLLKKLALPFLMGSMVFVIAQEPRTKLSSEEMTMLLVIQQDEIEKISNYLGLLDARTQDLHKRVRVLEIERLKQEDPKGLKAKNVNHDGALSEP